MYFYCPEKLIVRATLARSKVILPPNLKITPELTNSDNHEKGRRLIARSVFRPFSFSVRKRQMNKACSFYTRIFYSTAET
ncbi:hypothetical protein PoB_002466200 [Plakobranchus ocellatus]|uniref:Uncharacterized protein n=1 Tax=Plakobranchus ocellatus TaxID=259542 RepID=A0AAV3ZU04_9GAST|nr:hypothetical protein PoB_002466200 [Plakobranchus ocellatus]